jgi:hypothetical protein
MPRKVKSTEIEIAKTEAAPAAEPKKRAPRAKKTAAESAAPKAVRTRSAAATHKARATPAAPALRPELFQEEIARQAYAYWLERGGAHGHHHEDWLRAEQEVKQRYAAA